MWLAFFVILAAFASSALAKQCVNLTVPVQLNARNAVFNQVPINSNVDAAAFTANLTSIAGGTNYTKKVTTGYATITGIYNISAKFCAPNNSAGGNSTIQVLTHGIGFDKTYWDIPFNNFNYSYIDRMVDDHGYYTLSYDRLGIGNSSKANPYTVIQAQAEISALYYMSNALRQGTFPGINITFDGQNNKIVHVGHSFGSQQSYQLTLAYPNISDALVLTGFSFNDSAMTSTISSFGSKVARQNQPFRFGSTNANVAINTLTSVLGPIILQYNLTLNTLYTTLAQFNITASEARDTLYMTGLWDLAAGAISQPYPPPQNLPSGYLTWSDAWANQYNFFYPSAFDQTILYYAEANKQPFTVGELLTLAGAPTSSNFTGPVQILTGQQDAIYCAGDCLATGTPLVSSILASAIQYFGQSRAFETYVHPRTGHALNFHYNSTGAYQEIAGFLSRNGLAPSA